MASLPKPAIVTGLRRVFLFNLAGLGLVFLFSMVGAWYGLSYFNRRQVNGLLAVTGRLEQGDLATRVGPPYRPGELGKLGMAIDYMAGALQQREDTLKQQMSEMSVLKKMVDEMTFLNGEDSREALMGILHAISLIIEARDPYTAGHQTNVARLACDIGKKMGFKQTRLEGLRLAALVHDLGKIAVPAELLSKPARLKEEELSLIRSHCKAGYEILEKVEFLWPIAEIVLQHHERMDGSGYPKGLRGPDILLEARILGVADVVEAMSSHRPYRSSQGIEEALAEISSKGGILYDPEVVAACLECFHPSKKASPGAEVVEINFSKKAAP